MSGPVARLGNTRSLVLTVLVVVCASCTSLRGGRLYQSGTEALDAGQPRAAVARLEEAARLLPQASAVENHLGLAYQELGRRDDAVRAFERALVLDCDNAAADRNLRAALVQRAIGVASDEQVAH